MVPFGIHNSGQGPAALSAWWQSLPAAERAAAWHMASQPRKENPDSVNLDPQELWDFLQAGRDSGLEDLALETIWLSAAARNPAQAIKLIQQLADPAARARLEQQLAGRKPRMQ